jgi:nitroimidazol reductase NimA-like FMN-containing flavoprotein (pyridoxamine 5'-phosphate oxidase superfamily)
MSDPASSDTAFDVDAFLARPLTARLTTNGPTVRPVWYQWEDGAFWVFTGPWAKWFTRVQTDPSIALIIDTCDLDSGEILQVIAHGRVEIEDWDVDRGRRMLARYLGEDDASWPEDYRAYLSEPLLEGLSWVRLPPEKLISNDFSFQR